MENMVNELAAKRQSHIDEINGLNLNKIKAIVSKKNLSLNNTSINFLFFILNRIENLIFQDGKQEMSCTWKQSNTLKSLGEILASAAKCSL